MRYRLADKRCFGEEVVSTLRSEVCNVRCVARGSHGPASEEVKGA